MQRYGDENTPCSQCDNSQEEPGSERSQHLREGFSKMDQDIGYQHDPECMDSESFPQSEQKETSEEELHGAYLKSINELPKEKKPPGFGGHEKRIGFLEGWHERGSGDSCSG